MPVFGVRMFETFKVIFAIKGNDSTWSRDNSSEHGIAVFVDEAVSFKIVVPNKDIRAILTTCIEGRRRLEI